jgi:hypothetical protein
MGDWRYSSTILDPGRRWRWVVGFTPRPLCPRGKSLPGPLERRLGGPQSRFGRCREKKNLFSLPGVDLRPSSYSVYGNGWRTKSQHLASNRKHCLLLWPRCRVIATGNPPTEPREGKEFLASTMERVFIRHRKGSGLVSLLLLTRQLHPRFQVRSHLANISRSVPWKSTGWRHACHWTSNDIAASEVRTRAFKMRMF